MLWTVGLGRIFEIPESMNEVKTNQNKTRKQQQQKQNLFNHFFFFIKLLSHHYMLGTVPDSEDMQ